MMSLYYLILQNQVDILQKHFKKDHVHMRLWTRFYGTPSLAETQKRINSVPIDNQKSVNVIDSVHH